MKKALIVFGGWEGHDPVGVAKIFRQILEKEGFEVTASDTLEAFSSREALLAYDLIIPHWTMGTIPQAYAENVSEAVASGVGLAGCHGGMCDAFHDNTLWQFMTGSQWVAHPGNSAVTYRVSLKKSSSSPLIEGLEDFTVTSEQYYLHVDPAINVLATVRFPIADGHYAANGEVVVPAIYTKRWGKGRIYYNSLGHTSDLFDNNLCELMRRGFVYAAREEGQNA